MRALLLALGGDEHRLVLTLHHVACDAWSMGILVREVAALYGAFARGAAPELPEPPVQYADYAAWQRAWLDGPVLDEQIDWWRRRLAGSPPPLDLAAAGIGGAPVGPARGGARRGGREVAALPPEIAAGVRELARRQGATPFIVLFAAFQALLGRLAGVLDLVVGVPVAGRDRRELEDLIGLFLNMLPLRADLAGDPGFGELVARTRAGVLGAFAHQDVPFERLVEELRPPRQAGRAPFFEIAFGYQAAPRESFELPALQIRPLPVEQEAVRYELTLWILEGRESLMAVWTYDRDRFDRAAVLRLHRGFSTLLGQCLADPGVRLGALALEGAEEREEREREERRLKEAGRRRFAAAGKGG